ncbi:hypothetical protein ANCCAN_18768 [Ancylostoma caninum]|uniref:Uncharacterized protein n=1 Tax=Ancylostoma caninum TaxID=29170 RepID=A0A368FX74_ANCCA|nr:hypothetical protein ANCCAN_18768 [Ancylostoma caninum]
MLDCIFDCEMVPESHCKSRKSRQSLSDDSLLLGLQSVLRNVYIAEAILFKRLESSSTTEETERLSSGLTRLSEVERKLNLRIIDHINLLTLSDSEEER